MKNSPVVESKISSQICYVLATSRPCNLCFTLMHSANNACPTGLLSIGEILFFESDRDNDSESLYRI